ncbi:MAG: nucleotidyltransferase domain-containing protein [Limnochordia bacterium]|nr:nucleotidyltransferase domain-containing protein [Limnochordia bacterium]
MGRLVQPDSAVVNEIAQSYDLRLLIYFGSYQTEFYGPDSDIDIAYLAGHPLTTQERMGLHKDLMLAHRKSEVDLVDLQTADPILRYEIAREGRILFEVEKGLFDRYALFYVKRIYELRPIIKDRMRILMKEIKELSIDG